MQLELSLQAPPPPHQADVARLAGWLYRAGDVWLSAKTISASLGISDREIRHLATSSQGIIVSSPGSPGYKHVRHCDPEEVAAVAGRLEAQAKAMGDRAREIRLAFHRAVH